MWCLKDHQEIVSCFLKKSRLEYIIKLKKSIFFYDK